MHISAPLAARPFVRGTFGASTLAPWRYHVTLDGHPYMLDTARRDDWAHQTVPLLRPQADDSTTPGSQSLNPDGLWRRTWSSWHKGAGQSRGDLEDHNPYRFFSSVGVDAWERERLTLLPAVDKKRTSSATNLKLAIAGPRLFLVDGAAVVYTTDVTVDSPTWADTSGEPGGTILDIASDGATVWITDGANIYDAVASATPPDFTTAWSTADADVLAFAKGRLVGYHDGVISSFAADGTATAVTMTAVRIPATWTCVGFAGGPTNSVIYAAGYVGDKSLVLRVGIKEDGTGLDAAIVAGELPDGEIVRSIGTYLGFVLLGTDEGVRFAVPGANGDLTIGALMETGSSVRCFEGQGVHVWFGWDDFVDPDGVTHHGLGRLSLEEFASGDLLAPAYAADVMDSVAGDVASVVTFQDIQVYTKRGTGLGVYAADSVIRADGRVWLTDTNFGFAGEKVAVSVEADVEVPDAAGTEVSVTLDLDSEAGVTAGSTQPGTGVQTWSVVGLRSSRFRVALTLTRGSDTAGPVVRGVVLGIIPAQHATRKISLPLLLSSSLDPDGGVEPTDVRAERSRIEGWWSTRQPLSLNEVGRIHTVSIEDFRWSPVLVTDPVGGYAAEGTMTVICKEL